MVKTQTYGSMTIVPPKHVVNYRFKNGTQSFQTRDNGSSFVIRTGIQGSLTTFNGSNARFRPCTHQKTTYHLFSNPGSLGSQSGALSTAAEASAGATTTVAATVAGGWVPAVRSGVSSLYSNSALPAVPSVQWAALAHEALKDMLPSFASNNNVLQSLIELKDFRALAKGITRRFQGRHANLAELITGFKAGDKTLKQLSKVYLSYSFAWRPFFSDAVALIAAFTGFNRRWNEIIRRANTPQQSYWGTNIDGTGYSEAVLTTGQPTVPALAMNWWGDAKYRVRRVASKPARYSATLRYRYSVPPELTAEAGRLLALRDYLGTDPQLSHVWDTIPFSFIVDWFVNIGSVLDRVRVDNVNFKTEIFDFCHSVRVDKGTVLEVSLANGPNNVRLYGGWIPITGVISKYYERRVGIPDLRLAILASGLSFNEFLLGGALLAGRR